MSERFRVTIREREIKRIGCYDRFFCVVDLTRRKAMVAQVNATMPLAEGTMRDYARFLNKMHEAESVAH